MHSTLTVSETKRVLTQLEFIRPDTENIVTKTDAERIRIFGPPLNGKHRKNELDPLSNTDYWVFVLANISRHIETY